MQSWAHPDLLKGSRVAQKELPWNPTTGCSSYNSSDSDYVYYAAAGEPQERVGQTHQYTPVCKGVPVEEAAAENRSFDKEYIQFCKDAHDILSDVDDIKKFLDGEMSKVQPVINSWGKAFPDEERRFRATVQQLMSNINTVVDDLNVCMPIKAGRLDVATALAKLSGEEREQERKAMVLNGCAHLPLIRATAVQSIYPLASRIQTILSTVGVWAQEKGIKNDGTERGKLSQAWHSLTSWGSQKLTDYKGYLYGIVVGAIILGVLTYFEIVPNLSWLLDLLRSAGMCDLIMNPVSMFLLIRFAWYGIDLVRNASERKGERVKQVDTLNAHIADMHSQLSMLEGISKGMFPDVGNKIVEEEIIRVTTFRDASGRAPYASEEKADGVSSSWSIQKNMIAMLFSVLASGAGQTFICGSDWASRTKNYVYDSAKGESPLYAQLTSMAGNIQTKVAEMWNKMFDGTYVNQVVGAVKDGFNTLVAFLTRIGDQIKALIESGKTAVRNGVDSVRDTAAGAYNKASDMVFGVKDAADQVASAAGNAASAAGDVAESAGAAFGAAKEGLKAGLDPSLSTAATAAAAAAKDAAKAALKTVEATVEAQASAQGIYKLASLAETNAAKAKLATESIIQEALKSANPKEALEAMMESAKASGRGLLGSHNAADKEWMKYISSAIDSLPSVLSNLQSYASKFAAGAASGVGSAASAVGLESIAAMMEKLAKALSGHAVQGMLRTIVGALAGTLVGVTMVAGGMMNKNTSKEMTLPYKLHQYDNQPESDVLYRYDSIRPRVVGGFGSEADEDAAMLPIKTERMPYELPAETDLSSILLGTLSIKDGKSTKTKTKEKDEKKDKKKTKADKKSPSTKKESKKSEGSSSSKKKATPAASKKSTPAASKKSSKKSTPSSKKTPVASKKKQDDSNSSKSASSDKKKGKTTPAASKKSAGSSKKAAGSSKKAAGSSKKPAASKRR